MLNRQTPLIEYYNNWLVAHGLKKEVTSKPVSGVEVLKENTIEINNVSIGLQRTIRVPDDSETYLLPPVRHDFTLLGK